MKFRLQYLHERSSYREKYKTCKFSDRNILHEAEEALRTCRRRIKTKQEDKKRKSQRQDYGEEKKSGGMVKQAG